MKILRIVLLLLSLACLTACGHDPGYNLSDFNFPQTAEVQFVNLMSDSPRLTSTITRSSDSALAAQGSEDFAGASAQTSVIVGTYDVAVSYQDAYNNTQYLLDNKSVSYVDKDQFVYLFMGSLASPNEQRVYFEDPFFTGGIPAGYVEVWFANAANTPSQVDIYLTGVSTPIEATTPSATLTTENYSQPLTLSNRSAWRLRVTARGSNKILFDSGSFTMQDSTRTLFAVTDYFGPTTSGPLVNAVEVDAGGATKFTGGNLPSELRVINLIRDLPPLDVYFGSTSASPFAANIAQLTKTSYQNIDPGSYTLNVTQNGIKDQFVLEQNLEFGGGAYYTLVLTGRYNGGGTNSTISSVLYSTDPRPVSGRSTIRFINAGSVNKSVNVYLLDPGQAVGDNPPQIENVVPNILRTDTVHSGVTDVVVTSADNKNILVGPQRMTLNEGTSYMLVLVEDPVNEATQASLVVLPNI